jgi:Domain of unknown function (DUF4124)
MPKLKMLVLSCFLLTVLLAGAAFAGSVYRWTGDDGSVAFSDDAKRIPSQYRASAKIVRTGDLGSYGRYTPAETRAASQERSLQLRERIERLRELNETPAYAPAATRIRETSTILHLNNRSSITIPNDRSGNDEPVVVEQRRVRDRNNISTTHVTVVRQGDEILSVVRPESAHDRANWGSERELLGED